MMGTELKNMMLDGEWESGTDRRYGRTIRVPGLAADPAQMNEGTLWYRKVVELPDGDWSYATLVLNGARFCPAVWVNGQKVSETPGGMAVTTHLLRDAGVAPGKSITLEISLKSLAHMAVEDASRIPEADWWRSNISSCLWDTVKLHFHGSSRITRLIPTVDLYNDVVEVAWEIEDIEDFPGSRSIHLYVMDEEERVLAHAGTNVQESKGRSVIELKGLCKPWSPETPICYRLRTVLMNGASVMDMDEMTLGIKEFKIDGKSFTLNGSPVTLRAGSVVWHRWLRDPESEQLAFDSRWFEKNVVLRLKGHGANTLRFHLGSPPESFLDLCDKHGLMVQAEWSFFHGLKASKESLAEQWRTWFDFCMRHPSICIVHPWNETTEHEVETAIEVIDALRQEYPPMVISHRDVEHLHRYWWSMFENVGLYYDSYEQFELPVMSDEIGGNYLDGNGNPGEYPMLRESFLRFLGRDQTSALRLQLHTDSNAKMAEYWRQVNVAGFSPFCILGSPEDGNHHFLGKLSEGNPKPVWGALTAAYSPVSCSLQLWDRNFTPGQEISFPLHFFNETAEERMLNVKIRIVPDDNHEYQTDGVEVSCKVASYQREKMNVTVKLPQQEGEWRIEAVLQTPVANVCHPVKSDWRIRTMKEDVRETVQQQKVALPIWEEELRTFLESVGICTCPMDDFNASVILLSALTWERLGTGPEMKNILRKAIDRGCSVVMLNAGPQYLGEDYLTVEDLGQPLDEPHKNISNEQEMELFYGVKVHFTRLTEPESCIHPSSEDASLWNGIHKEGTWLWNGLRGGVIAPAMDMDITGLSASAFLSLWHNRGADISKIKEGNRYFSFELAGFYAFSEENDAKTKDELRKKVLLLVEDAPALENFIHLESLIKVDNLVELYKQSGSGGAMSLKALANCGKNLVRIPVMEISFVQGKGKLILSQLITNGRLAEGYGGEGVYGIRKDPAAQQFVLNMVDRLAGRGE